jgi:hypothetical protein
MFLKKLWKFIAYIVKMLDGITVITSDHGEAWGEFALPFTIPVYGHPSFIRIPSIREVPWLTIYKTRATCMNRKC